MIKTFFFSFFDFISSIIIININVNMDYLPETMDSFWFCFFFLAKCRPPVDSLVLAKLRGGYSGKDSTCFNAH